MATMSKLCITGALHGLPVKVVATGTAGTLIHTATAETDDLHEIWLWAVNSSTADVKLTIEWGAATEPDSNIEVTLTGESGLVQIIPGLVLRNTGTVKAFAGTANVILIHGFVNAIIV